MADSLDKYRKAQEKSIQIETQEGHPYKAFEFANVMQRRLDLRPGHDSQRIVNYGYLYDVCHAAGIVVALFFHSPQITVEIEGKNLQGMVDLLREEKIIAITEFVPEWHARPAEGEPIITKFVVRTPNGSTAIIPAPKH